MKTASDRKVTIEKVAVDAYPRGDSPAAQAIRYSKAISAHADTKSPDANLASDGTHTDTSIVAAIASHTTTHTCRGAAPSRAGIRDDSDT